MVLDVVVERVFNPALLELSFFRPLMVKLRSCKNLDELEDNE